MDHPRLRDTGRLHSKALYPLGEIPDVIIQKIGRHFVFLLCTGRKDITGSDWADAFAEAVGGRYLNSPVGIADVVVDNMAWSMKTVKHTDPFAAKTVRLISGRCSPDYSYGITDPHKDIEKTGRAVLGIWNERVNIAQDNYKLLRSVVLVRSPDLLSYCLFEEESLRFRTSDYTWTVNPNGNLVGKTNDGQIHFTWQPHGSQFTIHTEVPCGARKFTIKKPPLITKDEILKTISFDESWIEIKR